MLAASIHQHAGLGNQIWRYVCCRVFAETLGYEWGVSHIGWRGKFLNIDWGKEVTINVEKESDFQQGNGFDYYYEELYEWMPKVCAGRGRPDPKLLEVNDNTYINGIFQRMSYIEEHRDKIFSWLTYDDKYKVTEYSSENICVIQLRGGDYTTGHSMLPESYYRDAMNHMKQNNPDIEFVIVTDDPTTANKMLPGVPVVGSMLDSNIDIDQGKIGWYEYTGGPVSIDYSILNSAKYAIISASTFAFWPVWTNSELLNVIAPKYWFAWNQSDGWWRQEDSLVNDDRWLWLDKSGDLYTYEACLEEKNNYYCEENSHESL